MINLKNKSAKGFTLIELLVSIAIFVIFLGVVSVSYIGIVRSQRQANDVRKMYSDVRTFVESLAEDMRLGTVDYDCYKAAFTASNNSLVALAGKVVGGMVVHAAPLSPIPSGPLVPVNPQLLNLVNPCPFSTILDPQSSTADQSPYLAIVNKDRTQKVVYWFDKDNGKVMVKRYQRGGTSDNVDIAQWADVPGYTAGDEGSDPNTGSRSIFSDLVKVKNLTFSVNPPVNPYDSANYDKSQYQFQPKVTLTMTVENANKNLPPFHMDFQTTLSSRVYSRASS